MSPRASDFAGRHPRHPAAPAEATNTPASSQDGPASAAAPHPAGRSRAGGGSWRHPRDGRTTASATIPFGFFGMPFGIAGLATAYAYAARQGLATPVIRDGLSALDAAVWLILVVAYLRGARPRPWRRIADDLADGTQGPFAALVLIVPLVFTTDGLLPHDPGLARPIIDVLIVGIVALGSWLIGQWMYTPLTLDRLHPGYFLPTVAGGLLAAGAAAACGETHLGDVLFGIGVIFWLILGSMILARLFFGPLLPAALTPTIAIEVAPAPVATLAYLALTHDRIDVVAMALGGYALVMVLAQLPMLPAYLGLRFAPGFWSFAFSWAVVATTGLHWLADQHPAHWRIYSYAVLVAISLLIALIAARTAVALARRQFLPVEPAPPASPGRPTPVLAGPEARP